MFDRNRRIVTVIRVKPDLRPLRPKVRVLLGVLIVALGLAAFSPQAMAAAGALFKFAAAHFGA